MIVVSGPIAQPAPMRVAPRRNVEGSIVVSWPIVTPASISVLAGSTIVTPARWWASWMRRCARRGDVARSTRSLTPRARSGSAQRVRLDALAGRRAGAAGRRAGTARPARCRRRARRSAASSAPPSNSVQAGVDLADGELLLGRVAGRLGLHDALDAAVGGADDAAVAGRVVELHRRERRGGAGLLVGGDEPGDRLARDQRHVAVDHQRPAPSGRSVRGGGDRVARSRAARAWIATSTSSGRCSASRRLRVVDHDHPLGPGLARGVQRPEDHGAPADRVQDLGERGAHPGPLARGEDDHGGGGHGVAS